MKISKRMIKKLKPCESGWNWYLKYGTTDLLSTLLKVNRYEPDWACWLLTRMMTKKQCIEIAIFSATQVLPIFEADFPHDSRPREAIEAAKKVLKTNNNKNRESAYAANYAASSAATYATYANYAASSAAAYAAHAATYAASSAATYATYAASSATNYADSAAYYAARDTVDRIKLQIKIIKRAVKILERRK